MEPNLRSKHTHIHTFTHLHNMGFSLSNFTSDPFAISTVSFGIMAWVVAIAGAASSKQENFPHFSWWGISYQIVIILIIFVLYANNNIELYKFTLVGLVSIAFIYTTNSTNNLIYNSNSAGNLCCAAGCILLSILNLIWILYFGGHPESPTNQFIDSFSLRGQGHEQLGSGSHNHNANNANNNMPIGAGNAIIGKGEMSPYDDRFAASGVNQPTSESLRLASGPQMGNGPFTTTGAIINPNLQQPLSGSIGGSAHHTPTNINANNNNNNTGYMTSSHLTGLENFSSPHVPGSGAGAGLGVGAGRDLTHNSNSLSNSNGGGGGSGGGPASANNSNNTNKRNTIYTDSETGTGITFRYKAKALYSYDANPDDINEISFVKDEILEVDDIDGKWWQARRANGQVGICPSNYVKLLDT